MLVTHLLCSTTQIKTWTKIFIPSPKKNTLHISISLINYRYVFRYFHSNIDYLTRTVNPLDSRHSLARIWCKYIELHGCPCILSSFFEYRLNNIHVYASGDSHDYHPLSYKEPNNITIVCSLPSKLVVTS